MAQDPELPAPTHLEEKVRQVIALAFTAATLLVSTVGCHASTPLRGSIILFATWTIRTMVTFERKMHQYYINILYRY